MAVQIQIRNGTASAWTSANPTLAVGEMGAETDTGRFKIGTGSTAWNSLGYSLGVASKGTYSGATQYYVNDIVLYNSSSYICILASIGNLPTNGTYWNLLVQAGAVSSVAQTFTGGIVSVAGSPITGSGTLALTVAGTSGGVPYFSSGSTWASSAALASNALVVGGGAGSAPATITTGTGVVTALGVTTNAASGIVVKDADANITTNAIFEGFTSVAASGTTITLTASSTPVYSVTGSGGQVIQLPNATTLPNGTIFSFNNNQSSGAITVNNASATLVVSVPSGGYVTVVLLSNATSAGSWDRHDQTPSNVSWSTNTLDYPGSITSATWNGVAIAANRGGTGIANNSASTITISGAFGTTFTVSGTTAVTLPTTGTLATLAGTETFTNKTLTNPTVTNYVETLYTANTSTAITIDLANGTVQNLTLTGNATITMPTAVAGKSFIIILSQDGTGGRTVTWSTVSWPSATAPTITSTASKRDIYSFFSNGTSWFGVTVGQNYT